MMNNDKLPWQSFSPASAPNAVLPLSAPNAPMPSSVMPNAVMPMSVPNNAMAGAMSSPSMMMPQGATPPQVPAGLPITPGGAVMPSMQEESYVENILRMNLGKVATLYMTYENNSEWNAKIFKGVLEAAGRDHIIISDPTTGKRFLLLTLNLDYITFDEPLNYALPFGSAGMTR
ncbi:spore coat protein GerQ [Paenibacillaceae bacterium WGS1546]|uniref:spore coat protein GerQ n=1 Tax=Cohnella sp. WGS1546 TaxID=3366810 RepID=UPI00372D3355